eukprot:g48164.t1
MESMRRLTRGEGTLLGDTGAVVGLVLLVEFKRDVRGKFFTQRVASAWTALPEVVVEADITAALKKHLDKYMHRKGIEGYRSFEKFSK